MCTAVSYNNGNHYFGRNLDYEHDFGEKVIITPRNYPIKFKRQNSLSKHYAIIGMGIVEENYPLYFDATNEVGLSIAGLNFPDNAHYLEEKNNETELSPFELPLWLLAQYETTEDCKNALKKICLVKIPFNQKLPLSPLHWIVSDKDSSIVIEPTKSGLQIFENPYGVLTNNPSFDYHINNMANYLHVTAQEPQNRFIPCNIHPYSRGMGGLGLPGDNSSASRFVRAAFTKWNSICSNDEASSVNQYFHILNTVYQVNGCTTVGNRFEKTLYSSCCNTEKGIYYYTTYENSQINAVDLKKSNYTGDSLITIPLNRSVEVINAL